MYNDENSYLNEVCKICGHKIYDLPSSEWVSKRDSTNTGRIHNMCLAHRNLQEHQAEENTQAYQRGYKEGMSIIIERINKNLFKE